MKAVFLDAAGTLVHVREPVGVTYARIAAGHGIAAEATSLERGFRSAWKKSPQPQHGGHPAADDDRGWWRELVRLAFHEAGFDTGDQDAGTASAPETARIDAMFDELYAHFAKPEAWLVYPDVAPALDGLASLGLRLFVLSNFDRRLRSILAGIGLAGRFEQMIISSEIGASKPDPLIFATAARLAGCAPAECLHVGDDEQCDYLGALSAGFQARLIHRPEADLVELARELGARGVL